MDTMLRGMLFEIFTRHWIIFGITLKQRVNVLETKPITLLLFYTILIMNPVNLLAWFTSRCQSSMIHENSHILHA